MNIVKKVFCRVYQLAFRAALPILPYREPKILKTTDEIADVIKEYNFSPAIIVTDNFLKQSGATLKLEKALSDNEIKYFVYDKTRPNPTVENVDDALELYNIKKAKCLIAFGGGSAMDCAKAVGARAAYNGRSLERLRGNLKIFRKLPPIFAVPTTAGTGSEVTLTAVITDTVRKYKYTMNSFPLIPAYAVLDAENTYSLPKSLSVGVIEPYKV